MERSLFSARHCFVENLHDTGKMSDAEFSVLCEWFNFLAGGQLPKIDIGVDLIVYLRTSPETAYERKKARARKEEEVCFYVLTTQKFELQRHYKKISGSLTYEYKIKYLFCF